MGSCTSSRHPHDRAKQRHDISDLYQLSQVRHGCSDLGADPKLAVEVLFGRRWRVLLISAWRILSGDFWLQLVRQELKKGMNPARFYEYAL